MPPSYRMVTRASLTYNTYYTSEYAVYRIHTARPVGPRGDDTHRWRSTAFVYDDDDDERADGIYIDIGPT